MTALKPSVTSYSRPPGGVEGLYGYIVGTRVISEEPPNGSGTGWQRLKNATAFFVKLSRGKRLPAGVVARHVAAVRAVERAVVSVG